MIILKNGASMRAVVRAAQIAVILILVSALPAIAPRLRAAQSGSAAPSITFVADVPLLDCDGMPCIEVRVNNGSLVRLLIDTGNQASIIDTQTANTLHLKPFKPAQPNWPDGIFRAGVSSLQLGNLTLSDVRVLTMDVASMTAQNQMPHAAGTLAYTAFKDRALQLDFRAHRMRVSDILSSPAACDGTCDHFSLITFGKHGPPIVVASGFTINGHTVTAQIDTQYSGSLLVYTPSIDKLGLSNEARATETRTFPYTDGGVRMKFAPAHEEGFDGMPLITSGSVVYFPTPGVHEPDALFDATVGLELFRNTVLTLDFHDMTISVRKNNAES
ncbi:MAG: retropepsin-like aspartic protease [Candidatus Acidiferrales bacterium]